MSSVLSFSLIYEGAETERHVIDFYDVAQALIGFQRSLALVTHLVLNGEVITQGPSIKGAQILAYPPAPGSWKIVSVIALCGTVLHRAGTAPADTVLGHFVRSAYDYVIAETLGFHVDFDSTLGKQYDKLKKDDHRLPELRESQLDSVIEKCEGAIIQMHRPIVNSRTALRGYVAPYAEYGSATLRELNQTHEYVLYTDESADSERWSSFKLQH